MSQGALRAQVCPHGVTLMREQAIPDQDGTVPTPFPLQVVQEFDERPVGVIAGSWLKEERTAPEVPPEPDRHGNGELLPIEGTQEAPDIPRVILHSGQTLDEPCDARQRPQVRQKPVGPGTGSASCSGVTRACGQPASLPRAIPQHDTLATDTQAAGNGPLRLSASRK